MEALIGSSPMRGLSRRELLELFGASVAVAGLGGCGEPSSRDAAVAILDPVVDAVIVAVWARRARAATLELRDGTGTNRIAIELDASGVGAVELVGLAPGTRHELVVTTADGIQLGPYAVTTAPRADDPRKVTLAVIADIDPHPIYETDLIDHVIDAAPDLLVSLGDFPYTDNGPPAQTLDEYRERHVETRTSPRVRALLEAAPLYAIYDDHEFRNNWDAAFVAAEPERYAAAIRSWDEFFPVRDAGPEVRYRSWRWGAHAECFLLDTRRFRSANGARDDAAKTMLGAAQRDWLIDGVTRSTATFKLVFTGVPLAFALGDDAWHSFATERDAILDALADAGVSGLVFASADQHFFAAHRLAHGIREFQFGPVARGVGPAGPMTPGVIARAMQFNAGLLVIDGDRLTVTAIGPGGQPLYTEVLTADALTPRRALAAVDDSLLTAPAGSAGSSAAAWSPVASRSRRG
jgi:hypothetical protein